jgi:manganese-dependent inorganic pyrophosphatase
MIVTGNFPVNEDLLDEARSNGTCILQTPYDSATTVRRLKFSSPAESMLQEEVVTFHEAEKLSDLKDVISGEREETFPVLDDDGCLAGVLSKDYLEHELPLKLILVDHNELTQAVDGASEVPIIEILDHHRLGSQQTQTPITFINEVVGSSCTLVTEQFRRFGHAPSAEMAGILMGGIITDTLMLRSPTSTPRDKLALDWLKVLCGAEPKTLANEILSVGSSIAALPARQVITADKKDYNTDKFKFAVAQVEEVGFENFFQHRGELLREVKALVRDEELDFFGLLVTNVVRETSMMLCSGEKRILDRINYTRLDDNTFDLPGVLSRKKQLLPHLLKVMS